MKTSFSNLGLALFFCLLPGVAVAHEESTAEEAAHTPHATPHGEEVNPLPHAGTEHSSHDGAEHPSKIILFGAKGAAYGAFHHGESAAHPAAGLFVALIAIPHHLEIELDAKAVFGHEHTSFPVALMVKKPFHASEHVHPFVGLGPLVVFAPSEHGLHVYPGGEAVVGTYIWFTEHIGLTFEVSYGLIKEEEALIHELGAVGGPVFTF